MEIKSATHSESSLRLSVLDVGVAQLSVRLARHVERLGYHRYWISEHHGEGSISSPTVLVSAVAAATETIRVGTAGVLLRFQSALAVAESFRTLSLLFPNRIDAGIARATAYPAFASALADGRPEQYSAADHAAKLLELQRLLCGRLPAEHPLAAHRIDPSLTDAGPPPLWVHSTSSEGARVAAQMGAHYGFLDCFARAAGPAAVQCYRDEFRPSRELQQPSWAVCVGGFCAEDEREAAAARARFAAMRAAGRILIIGTASHWRDELGTLMRSYQTGDFIIQTVGGDYDVEAQVRSLARIADVARSLANPLQRVGADVRMM